jgi:hypothetical protein
MPDPRQVVEFNNASVTLAAGVAGDTISDLAHPAEVEHLCLEVENTGSNALTAAILQVRATRAGTFADYISAWTTATALMKSCTTRLDTLGAGLKTVCYLEIPPCSEWKLVLTSTSGTTVVVRGWGR